MWTKLNQQPFHLIKRHPTTNLQQSVKKDQTNALIISIDRLHSIHFSFLKIHCFLTFDIKKSTRDFSMELLQTILTGTLKSFSYLQLAVTFSKCEKIPIKTPMFHIFYH